MSQVKIHIIEVEKKEEKEEPPFGEPKDMIRKVYEKYVKEEEVDES